MVSTTKASDTIAVFMSVIFAFAGQAHFTDQFTPGLADEIDAMTRRTHGVYSFLGVDHMALKYILGAFDLTGTVLLFPKSNRKAGFAFAIVNFAIGLFAQVQTNGNVFQVAALMAVAAVGLVLSFAEQWNAAVKDAATESESEERVGSAQKVQPVSSPKSTKAKSRKR